MIELDRYDSDLTDEARPEYDDVIATADSIQGFTKHTLLSSAGGRGIYGYSIGDEGKPCVVIDGAIHNSHEWKSVYSVLEMMRVVSNPQLYSSEANRVAEFVSKYRFYFIPVVSPDSFVNRVSLNDNGVWVNRNFDYSWLKTDRSTKGPAPFSETESQNIRNVVLSENTAIYINVHTVGNDRDLAMMRPVEREPINPIIQSSSQLMTETYSDYGRQATLSVFIDISTSYNWASTVKGAYGNVVGLVFESGYGLNLQQTRSLSVYGMLTLLLNIADYLENADHSDVAERDAGLLFFKSLGEYLSM